RLRLPAAPCPRALRLASLVPVLRPFRPYASRPGCSGRGREVYRPRGWMSDSGLSRHHKEILVRKHHAAPGSLAELANQRFELPGLGLVGFWRQHLLRHHRPSVAFEHRTHRLEGIELPAEHLPI